MQVSVYPEDFSSLSTEGYHRGQGQEALSVTGYHYTHGWGAQKNQHFVSVYVGPNEFDPKSGRHFDMDPDLAIQFAQEMLAAALHAKNGG